MGRPDSLPRHAVCCILLAMRPCDYLVMLCILAVSGCAGPSLEPGHLRKAYTRAYPRYRIPAEDVSPIRRLVLEELKGTARHSIAGIRWTSPSEVIVYGNLQNTATDSGTASFLLSKKNGVWRLVQRQND